MSERRASDAARGNPADGDFVRVGISPGGEPPEQVMAFAGFDFMLRPLGTPGTAEVQGLALDVVPRSRRVQVSLLFDRSEFVNIATAGLAMLDAGDAAADETGGGEL